MRVIFYVLLVLCSVAFTACDAHSYASPLGAEVRNRTKNDFTEVSVKGKGYPGGFGNLVSGGMKVMTYYRGEILDDEFEVSWKNSEGLLQSKILKRPDDFGKSREKDLIVEFTASGDVIAYTEIAPWANK